MAAGWGWAGWGFAIGGFMLEGPYITSIIWSLPAARTYTQSLDAQDGWPAVM